MRKISLLLLLMFGVLHGQQDVRPDALRAAAADVPQVAQPVQAHGAGGPGRHRELQRAGGRGLAGLHLRIAAHQVA